MNKYKIVLNREREIEAVNEEEAEDTFWNEMEEGNSSIITSLGYDLKIIEIKK